MQLSLKTIELCRRKLGEKILCGFEQYTDLVKQEISVEDGEKAFNELVENELINLSEENIRLNALGQHILNMMANPDQFIMIENMSSNIIVRIYIRNVYYLSVVERVGAQTDDDESKISVNLLPTFNQVVGAFAFSLSLENEAGISNNDRGYDFHITGKAWDEDRNVISDYSINGNYENENIRYQTVTDNKPGTETESDVSTLINYLTTWMFDRISETKAFKGE